MSEVASRFPEGRAGGLFPPLSIPPLLSPLPGAQTHEGENLHGVEGGEPQHPLTQLSEPPSHGFFTAFPLFGAVPLGGLRLLTPQAGGAPGVPPYR